MLIKCSFIYRLNKELDIIIAREQKQKDDLFQDYPTIETKYLRENDNKYETVTKDSLVHCQFCNKICYISYVQHFKNLNTACLEHYKQLIEYDKRDAIILYENYTLEELQSIHKHIEKLSSRVSDWKKKYKKYMNENKYPSLKYLQQLLNMTEKFPYTIKEIHTLKNYLKVVNIWVEEANILLLRDKRNVNKENLKPRSLNQIKILIDKADSYAFESSEIKTLKSLYEAVINFQVTVSSFFKSAEQENASLNDVKELVKEGRDLDVDIPEMKKLELLYENLVWRKESELVIVDGEIEADYATVTKLIAMAKECKIPEDNKVYQDLVQEKEKADHWKARAEKLMAKPEIELKELESLLDEINDIPNIEGLMEDLHDMRVKAEDYIDMAKMYLEEDNGEEEEKNVKNQEQKQEQEPKQKPEEKNGKRINENENNVEKVKGDDKNKSINGKVDVPETIKIKKEPVDENDKDENSKEEYEPTNHEETDNDLCRHFDMDPEEDEDTLYEDSMDLGKEDYQKIKKNKERIISQQKGETSKFDLKFILNNNSPTRSGDENDTDNALNSEVNSLVYSSIVDAVGEIKKEPLIDLANTPMIHSESEPSIDQLNYELPERAIDIEHWKEANGLDDHYRIKEPKRSGGSRKKNDKKNKKKKVVLTMQDFENFIDTLNNHKVKIDIQKALMQQHQKIQNLFRKGLNYFDHSKNCTFAEKLEEVLENIENCIQTLNLCHPNDDMSPSPTLSRGNSTKVGREDSKSKTSNAKEDRGSKRINTSNLNSHNNDSSGSNSPVKNAYCFCRTPGEGFMVACDICNEWYHGQW